MHALRSARLLATRTAISPTTTSRSAALLRFQTTQANPAPPPPPQAAAAPGRATIVDSSIPSQQPQPTPSSPTPPTPKSKHKLVYREIWPPLVRVLTYASIVYFSLQLSWNYLDGREQRQLENEVRQELEDEVRKQVNLKAEPEHAVKTGPASSRNWFSWASGK